MSDNAGKSTPTKKERVGQRVSEKLKLRITNIDRDYGVSEATMLVDGLEAMCAYIEATKGYRRPIKVVWDQEAYDQMKQKAADEQALYEAGKRSGQGSPKKK